MVQLTGMTLSSFLSKIYPDATEGEALANLAKVLGVTVMCARRYIHGQRIPRPEHMEKIREWSGGCVNADDFYRTYRRND